MKYAIVDKDTCVINGIDTISHRVVDGYVILNENDLISLSGSAESAASRLSCTLMDDDDALAWLYEHNKKNNK